MGGITTTLFQRPRDPQFNNTTLLLSGNFPTNGAQNNTFLDSSSNGFSITRNPSTGPNAPTQGSFSPFSLQSGQWSNYFGGSAASSVNFSAPSQLSFGTGDFTIEGWFYTVTSSADRNLIDFRPTSTNGLYPNIFLNSSNQISYLVSNSVQIVGGSVSPNVWYHFALSRVSGSTRLYLNGTQVGSTYTDSNNYIVGTNRPIIGEAGFGSFSFFTGYLSNLRFIKGTGLYTGSSFTVPISPLTSVTNTSALILQSNRIVDNSGNNLAVTGSPSVQPFSPFVPSGAYTTTAVGGSGYFDGTGDYLSFTNNTSTNLGTGDFTFEAWVYPVALSSFNMLFAAGGANNYFALKWGATSSIFGLNAYNGTQDVTSSSLTTPINQWTHIAFVRISGTIYFYINGVAAGSGAFTSAWGTSTGTATIGFNATYAGQYFVNGYISNLRVVKGTAVYTGAFTPPRAPLATSGSASASAYSSTTNVNTSFASSETSLLCNFTNAGIVDSTAKNVLETVGNAQISTTQSKFGGTSMYFDGTDDRLFIPTSSQNQAMGTGDWTVEFWFYSTITTFSNWRIMLDFRPNGTNGAYITCSINASAQPIFYTQSAERIIGNAIVSNQWYHFAVCKANNSTRMFINGVQNGSTYSDTNSYLDSGRILVASGGFSPGTEMFIGYIDDLRITRGVARYTANFNVPTIGFTDR